MWPKLKKYFIPHQSNDHRPHGLRWAVVSVILAGILLIELLLVLPAFLLFPRSSFLADVLPPVLVSLTNQRREAARLPNLEVSPILTAAAQQKAADMAARGYFSHQDPSGAPPWDWLRRAGYTYDFAGENLAINFIDSADVVRAWMESPTHRDNIIRSTYTQIGIGVANGYYQGRPSMFVVQFFGRPSLFTWAQPAAAAAPAAWQELLTQPRSVSTNIFFAAMALVALALLLNIFIKIKVQHSDLLANGLSLLCLLATLLLINSYLFQPLVL
ncbi:MAG: CAP domain-containing protein [Candidatus Vogelbacteria bacterium]|nr:CAP domain-containing protein [Candidatus Vogelbacteria bacterium]